ncbi:hypothetical protein Clacol_005927 [Clathrus columnatus]|uniref:Uncharacterized protein n=1 Tax=Clathrus columnatus TaxID=1419009 RepID=A0AAV5AGS6_9AGAM|nr:hypothetical protein Clacol_005927 [Clathrus columnatus]
MATLLSQVTNPLFPGLKNAVSIQLQTSIEGAVTIAGSIYQSLGLRKTSALDMKHELETLSATIGVGPKGVAVYAAISRTTASIKSLPGPVTQDEGIALLNSFQEVQVKISILSSDVGARVASIEQGAPGLCGYGFKRGLALLTSSISTDEVQARHNSIESACNDALTKVRDLPSNVN